MKNMKRKLIALIAGTLAITAAPGVLAQDTITLQLKWVT